MSKFKTTSAIIVLLVAAVAAGLWLWRSSPRDGNKLDGFAMCLRDQGVTMYGAYWCSHCQNEKRAFGDSFKYVPYVECTEETQKCLDAGVKGYPTWLFPASSVDGSDGRRFEGEMGLAKLSEASGCVLPDNN